MTDLTAVPTPSDLAADPAAATRTRTYAWADPRALAELGAHTDGLELLRAVIDGRLPGPPIAATMGFTLVEAEAGRVVFGCEPAEWHYNPLGTVHGGLACTLLDSAMGCAVQSRLPAGTGYTTLDVQVRFTRPMTVETGAVRVVGETVSVGRRTATARAEILDGRDRLLAHATTACLVFPLDAPAPEAGPTA